MRKINTPARWAWSLAAAFAIMCALSACSRKGWSDAVPMQAAAEATLVCQSFGGLEFFVIEYMGPKEVAGEPPTASPRPARASTSSRA